MERCDWRRVEGGGVWVRGWGRCTGGRGGAECGGVDGWSKEGSLPSVGDMFLTGTLTQPSLQVPPPGRLDPIRLNF